MIYERHRACIDKKDGKRGIEVYSVFLVVQICIIISYKLHINTDYWTKHCGVSDLGDGNREGGWGRGSGVISVVGKQLFHTDNRHGYCHI